jgi:hypothetical protein
MAGPQAKDAQYRPFRAAAWAFYLLIAVAFSVAITINVVRSTLAMTPDRPPASKVSLSPQECLDTARALWNELDARRKSMSEATPVRGVDAHWTSFRIDWLKREHEADSRCAQKKIFEQLDSLMDLYTTHAVQFAGEIGPTIDELNANLEAASRGPSAPAR